MSVYLGLILIFCFSVGCYNGLVYVLKRNSGEKYWTFTTEDAVKSSPAVDPTTGLVYVGSHDQHAYALDIYVRLHLISVHHKHRRGSDCNMLLTLGAGVICSPSIALGLERSDSEILTSLDIFSFFSNNFCNIKNSE